MKRILDQVHTGRHLWLFGLLAGAAIVAAGCKSDPVQSTPSFSANGTVLTRGTADLAVDSSGVHGMIDVTEKDVTAEIGVAFIARSDSKRTVPTGTDFKLAWTVADTSTATVEAVSAWSFKVHGVKAGTTTVIFKVMHGTNADYTSSPITITVHPAVHGLAKGDTATFKYNDRDTMNQKVSGSDRRKVWVVAQTGMTVGGRTGVSQIIERTYTLAGAEEGSADTLYLIFDTDGTIYQYDFLRRILLHVTAGASFSSSLQPIWVKMTNAQQVTAATWSSMSVNGQTVDSQVVKGVQPPGIPVAVDITFWLNASHKGTQAATVAAGAYADAVHTDQTLRLLVRPSAIPITALNDSLAIHCDASGRDGLLRLVLESKILVASVLTTSATLDVNGYDMELESVKRK